MVYIDKFIYIFGGYDGIKRTNDFYKYDVLNKIWAKIYTTDLPPGPRERHVAGIFLFKK